MTTLTKLLATPAGQAALAFLRLFLVTFTASWMNAGLPMHTLTWALLGQWAELAAQAGAALVIVNYIAPWEKRYGLGKNGGSPSTPTDQ